MVIKAACCGRLLHGGDPHPGLERTAEKIIYLPEAGRIQFWVGTRLAGMVAGKDSLPVYLGILVSSGPHKGHVEPIVWRVGNFFEVIFELSCRFDEFFIANIFAMCPSLDGVFQPVRMMLSIDCLPRFDIPLNPSPAQFQPFVRNSVLIDYHIA